MQTVLNTSLPGTAVLQRNTQASDGQGGKTDAWAAYGTVACRISPFVRRMGGEENLGARVEAVRERLITLPASTDITETDRIVTGGQTFEVLAMDGARSYELGRRVHAARI
jgi:Phage head-tail joining protein.